MRIHWLAAALISASLLAVLHIWAITDFLYWRYRWFDTPMHILGGVTIALIAVALLHSFRPFSFMGIVATAFIAWEVLEVVFGVTFVSGTDYVWDTAHDLLNDVLGATAVYALARFTVWRPHPASPKIS